MTPRPLIKWKSFRLGLLVLGFLGAAWILGMKDNHWFYASTPRFSLGAAHDQGRLMLFVNVARFEWGIGVKSSPHSTPVAWFPAPLHAQVSPANANGVPRPAHAHLRVAHWLLILLFSLVWSAWLFWHSKWEHKKPSP